MGMIDVSGKEDVLRTAIAGGRLVLKKETLEAMKNGKIKKGDPFTTGEVAALHGIKTTHIQIPHCHPIPITSADIEFSYEDDGILCKCTVKAEYRTGVEMEALAGVTAGLLTVWDMVKYLEKDEDGQYPKTEITEVKVYSKQKEE